jgi:hypothetical protein
MTLKAYFVHLCSGSFAIVIGGFDSAYLTPASGRQQHTTSPSASSALVCSAISVERIPLHVRDDREAPLFEQPDGQSPKSDLDYSRSEIFLQQGLDSFGVRGLICPSGGRAARSLATSSLRGATRRSSPFFRSGGEMDCFAESVTGRAFARPRGWQRCGELERDLLRLRVARRGNMTRSQRLAMNVCDS